MQGREAGAPKPPLRCPRRARTRGGSQPATWRAEAASIAPTANPIVEASRPCPTHAQTGGGGGFKKGIVRRSPKPRLAGAAGQQKTRRVEPPWIHQESRLPTAGSARTTARCRPPARRLSTWRATRNCALAPTASTSIAPRPISKATSSRWCWQPRASKVIRPSFGQKAKSLTGHQGQQGGDDDNEEMAEEEEETAEEGELLRGTGAHWARVRARRRAGAQSL